LARKRYGKAHTPNPDRAASVVHRDAIALNRITISWLCLSVIFRQTGSHFFRIVLCCGAQAGAD
jgi:hypothetical protein